VCVLFNIRCRYGHPLIGLTVADVNAEEMLKYPSEQLDQLVAQKLSAYKAYMEYLSCVTDVTL
jgi:hypothetical protein